MMAALYCPRRHVCWQAFAQVLATNVVGPALLTGALYKQLRAAAKLAKAVRPAQRLSAAPAAH